MGAASRMCAASTTTCKQGARAMTLRDSNDCIMPSAMCGYLLASGCKQSVLLAQYAAGAGRAASRKPLAIEQEIATPLPKLRSDLAMLSQLVFLLVDNAVKFTTDRFGRLDTLVNTAGGSPAVAAATVSPRFSEAILRLNLIAPLNFAQAANAVMQGQHEGGRIINIASVSGVRPSPGTAAYGAAKEAIRALSKSAAREWGRDGIRVNIICPLAKSPGVASLLEQAPEMERRMTAGQPLGRIGECEEDIGCLLYTSPSPRDATLSRMPSSA